MGLSGLIGTAALLAHSTVLAQMTSVKFQLDWRFEGPAALFLLPKAKGYFEAEKLDVTIDTGNGSGNAVNRVASGAYEMGFADLAALMEFWGNNAGIPSKPVAVMMVYNNTPAAVMALKKSGIKTPADLNGKKLGAPVFDARLVRNRHGPVGRWIMEWKCDECLFSEPAAHPQPVAATPAHRPHQAQAGERQRRTG